MELTVLDSEFRAVRILDTCSSIIWTDRCFSCGDFEYHTSASGELLDLFLNNSYLQLRTSDRLMVIEGVELSSDPEDGNQLKITGRSIESILDRRIVWNPIKGKDKFQNVIKSFLMANIIAPSDGSRKIPNLIFRESSDPALAKIELEYDCRGDNLYEFIQTACSDKKVGFRIRLENTTLVFELFMGTDRSYDQNSRPYVIFSPKMENIINSNYVKSTEDSKNVVLVSIQQENQGQEEVTYRTLVVNKDNKSYSGYIRREHYMEGENDKDDATLIENAKTELREHSGEELFEGEVDATHMYKYGVDFFIGDIVQIANEYGMTSKTRVTEFIHSEDKNGIESYPAFEVVK